MDAIAVVVVTIAGIVAIMMRIAAIVVWNFYMFAIWKWANCSLLRLIYVNGCNTAIAVWCSYINDCHRNIVAASHDTVCNLNPC